MTAALVLGDFDSEKYWRGDELSKLPFIEDHSSTGIIFAMDELLFPFCQKNDFLVTRFAFDPLLKEYLQTVGFEFKCSRRDVHTTHEDEAKSIFEIIAQDEPRLRDVMAEAHDCTDLAPYSIVPGAELLAKKMNLKTPLPSFEAVKKVNSKAYSTLLGHRLGFGFHGEIIYSGEELDTKGRQWLAQGPFLIKDFYGVSGKGNQLINSVRILERVVKHLGAAEAKGKSSHFVIERLLEKDLDFSCGLTIKADGRVEIGSIQKILNHQFAYGGSETANEEFCNFLRNKHYFDTIAKIAAALYQDGYFGPVCVDSMLLKTEEIVPVIEINARKSMGFINRQIDSRLAEFGVKGTLMKLDLGVAESLTMEAILAKFTDQKILFGKGKDSGVLPLSANTVFQNRKRLAQDAKMQIPRGRMYFSVIAPDEVRKAELLRETVMAFEELACKLYSKV